MEWQRFRGLHPPACTCVDCEERHKWRLPKVPRYQARLVASAPKPGSVRTGTGKAGKGVKVVLAVLFIAVASVGAYTVYAAYVMRGP